MMEALDNINKYGSLTVVIISILAIFVSGIFFGVTYFIMDSTQTAFENANCTINDNTLVSSCQDLWSLSVYPFLALKDILVWASFFFIFALTLGLLIIGYRSGKSPVLMGLLIIFVIVLTYGAIEISNIYRTMLEVSAFNSMMVEFTVYNKIMLNFPWFVFFVSLMAVMLSIVNYQRTKTNTPAEDLDY